MKILVTGATGFVGSHLCELLISSGHEVFALVRNPTKAKEFKVTGIHIRGDLSDLNWTDQLPADLDAVVHTAGIVHSFNKQDFYDINAEATHKLINALKKYKSLSFILISSQAAGGPATANKPATEDTSNAVSEYGRSKLKAEEYLAQAPTDWNKCAIRPPMVIGPRDPAVLDIFKMVKSGFVVSPGAKPENKQYSYVCVFDLVAFINHAVEKKLNGVFYCAYPKSISFAELIAAIGLELKKGFLTITIPKPLLKIASMTVQRLGEMNLTQARLTADKLHELLPAAWVCDSTKSQRENFKYEWDIKRTIESTLKDYQDRNWL